jgi:hypothetical protein
MHEVLVGLLSPVGVDMKRNASLEEKKYSDSSNENRMQFYRSIYTIL